MNYYLISEEQREAIRKFLEKQPYKKAAPLIVALHQLPQAKIQAEVKQEGLPKLEKKGEKK